MSRKRNLLDVVLDVPDEATIIANISGHIQSYLTRTNSTLADLSRKTGIPYTTLLRYARGERVPRTETVIELSRALGMSIEQMIYGNRAAQRRGKRTGG